MTRARPTLRLLAALFLLVPVGLLAPPAWATLTKDTGDCRAEVRILGNEGTVVTATEKTDRLTVDPAGAYAAGGLLEGGAKGKIREYRGSLKFDLPPPFPDWGPKSWTWGGASRDRKSTQLKKGNYDFPSWVPRGFDVPLIGAHKEKGVEVCTFEAKLTVKGEVFDAPLAIGAAAGTGLFGLLMLGAGIPRKDESRRRGRRALGILAGLPFGGFLALTLVFLDALPMNSVLVTVMPFIGGAFGLLLAFVAPFGRRRSAKHR